MGNSLAIIPARGGSKRIPKKNIRDFAGKPIIAYSVELALTSGLFDQVVVTTDCEEIAEVARRYGAETPFQRAANLSDDTAPTIKVIGDAVRRVEALGATQYDAVCCILPTAPLLTPEVLKEGFQMLSDEANEYVVSVGKYHYPIFRAFELTEQN
ncbi:MAG: pseudaminic acid cytidylyltransferase, partial [Alphaproteobacteria bacterium]